MDSSSDPTDLQFDSATSGRSPLAEAAAERLTCAVCRNPIDGEYFDVNGRQVCRSCSGAIAAHAESPRGLAVFGRAAGFGTVASILGAILYFAVIAVSGLEIGLVAIAIGYIVGYGVRMGTRGRGGRRFQILALVLTYWAMGLAYSSLALKEIIARDGTKDAASAAAAPATPGMAPDAGATTRTVTSQTRRPTGGEFAIGLIQLLDFTWVLPVLVIVGSLPGGLISAAIVVFGMLQAWRMTAAPALVVSGPYRIGPAAAAPG